MLKLKDKNKKLVAGLINYKDLCIESALSTGDKKLSFSLHKKDKFYNFIEEEGYIETKTQEYVIKAKDVGVDYTRFDCVLNLETLEANIFDRFESVEQTITNALNLAIVGTGWTVKDNTLKKKRTVRCTNKNALEIVQEIKKTYRVDIVFNTLSKQIEVYEHLGEDKGTYFIDSLNLTALQVQSDSYKFATRIIAEGKDNLTFEDINGGKNYVENFQYSKKIKTIYWKDERYTVKESLLEDAKAKLEEISKPYTSYNASILNLAELNPKYKNILDYKLGDTITLISKNNKVKDKQRIVKTVEYPQDHSRDTAELANAVLKFEDIQQENQETTDTVNNITVDNGTIDGSTIDGIKVKQIEDFKANVVEVVNLKAINANIDNLHANKADIQDLHAVTAKIGTLEATKADITQLNAVNADISNLNAIKANITELNAANGKIDVLESKTASIDNLLAGNLTANNFKANSITANSGIIAEGAIGSGQISSLTANKINAGTIDLSLVTVAGPNGRLRLQGNKLQIMDNKDGKLYERIMLGVDSNNNSSLVLRGADGKTILLNQDGLTKAGITEGFNKIDDNSIDASLIFDKNSMVRNINGATETIKGTRIQVGDRTLDVELSTQKNTITEHSKELSTQKASIQALDNAIKLKVDSQVYRDSINTINNNISITNSNLSKATTELNLLKEKIESKVNKTDIDKTVEEIEDKIKLTINKISTVESKFTQENNSIKASIQDLNSTTKTITANVSNINKEISTVNTKVLNVESSINILKEKIESKVSQSDIDKSITTVDNKIKLIDSKISDVSSTVIQLRDSVTTQINSINSKTQSIETNLNGKASKQEVTEVNNRVATIKASLDGITQRVSATESKTQTLESNLNGKASKQEVNNVSSKVVSLEANLNGITNRVSSTESRINTLNGQVQNAITKQEFTEFKQSSKDAILDIQSTSPKNYVSNPIFNTGDLTNWEIWGNGTSWAVRSDTSLSHAYSLKLQCFTRNQGVMQAIKGLNYGKKYTLKVKMKVEQGTPGIMIRNDNKWEGASFNPNQGYGKWVEVKMQFWAREGTTPIYIGNVSTNSISTFWVSEIMLHEGYGEIPFNDNNKELYSANFKADLNGIECTFEDNSYTKIGRGGFEWWKNGMKHPYHCLMARGSMSNVNSGQVVRIWLPEVFRGKEYEIGWWTGNVFPANPTDCLYAVNSELVGQNKQQGWFDIKMSMMVRNPNNEGSPNWRGKANVVWIAIA
ncbi:phage tail spike protein [Clostridium perfringens]|nr:phage tail spike protein [Clostridium perfringens]